MYCGVHGKPPLDGPAMDGVVEAWKKSGCRCDAREVAVNERVSRG